MRFLLAASLCSFALFACSHSHDEAYPTYQECYTDHTVTEALPIRQAVVICCTDHDIGSVKAPVCGATAASCTTYVNANLSPALGAADVAAACTDFETQLGK